MRKKGLGEKQNRNTRERVEHLFGVRFCKGTTQVCGQAEEHIGVVGSMKVGACVFVANEVAP